MDFKFSGQSVLVERIDMNEGIYQRLAGGKTMNKCSLWFSVCNYGGFGLKLSLLSVIEKVRFFQAKPHLLFHHYQYYIIIITPIINSILSLNIYFTGL